jgi:hypothetical protein
MGMVILGDSIHLTLFSLALYKWAFLIQRHDPVKKGSTFMFIMTQLLSDGFR